MILWLLSFNKVLVAVKIKLEVNIEFIWSGKKRSIIFACTGSV